MKSSAFRRILRIAGWNAGLVLVGLAGVELVFGHWFFGPNLGLLAIPRDVSIVHRLDYLPGRPVARYTRDSFGLRGTYGRPSDIDVIVVGGSTTNELYVGDGETYVDVMRAALAEAAEKAGKKPPVVVNAGVDGHSTVGHLRAFDVWFPRIPDLKPRWVVFYVGINDVFVDLQAEHDSTISETRGTLARLQRYLKNHSALFELHRIVVGSRKASRQRVVHGGADASTAFPQFVDDAGIERRKAVLRAERREALRQYRSRVEGLVEKTRALGARPIFVTQRRGDVRCGGQGVRNGMAGASVNAIDDQLLLENIGDVTLDVCAAMAVACVDLGRELRFENGDFYDTVHVTTSGAKKIGIYLGRRIAPVVLGQEAPAVR